MSRIGSAEGGLPAWIVDLQARAKETRELNDAANAAARAARLANFKGKCRACFDVGECGECARGRTLAAANDVLRRAAAAAEAFDALQLPRRFTRYALDTYPGNVDALAELRAFLDGWDGEEGLILAGAVGVGKTGLLVGALRHLLTERADLRDRVAFITSTDLLDELREGFDDGSYSRRLQRVRNVRLLAIDDLGAEHATDWARDRLYAVLNHRYEEVLPTFLTTNYGREPLAARIGERLTDRLIESCRRIVVPGGSLRAGH